MYNTSRNYLMNPKSKIIWNICIVKRKLLYWLLILLLLRLYISIYYVWNTLTFPGLNNSLKYLDKSGLQGYNYSDFYLDAISTGMKEVDFNGMSVSNIKNVCLICLDSVYYKVNVLEIHHLFYFSSRKKPRASY